MPTVIQNADHRHQGKFERFQLVVYGRHDELDRSNGDFKYLLYFVFLAFRNVAPHL